MYIFFLDFLEILVKSHETIALWFEDSRMQEKLRIERTQAGQDALRQENTRLELQLQEFKQKLEESRQREQAKAQAAPPMKPPPGAAPPTAQIPGQGTPPKGKPSGWQEKLAGQKGAVPTGQAPQPGTPGAADTAPDSAMELAGT